MAVSLGAMLCLGLQAMAATMATAEDFSFIPGTFNPAIGPDGNTEVYASAQGLVVIDTGRHPAHVQKILDLATSKNMPIVAVINTHWHLDHTTGNLDIRAADPDVQVYGTPAINGALKGFLAESIELSRQQLDDPTVDDALRFRANRFLVAVDQGAVLPDIPLESAISLPVNGRELQINVTRPAVTESDIWIWDPATKTVIAGDIVTLPVPFFDTACVEGWLVAFDEIGKKPLERVVPGHGYIMLADEFRLYRNAFEHLLNCAAEATGAECAEGWLADAAPLLDKAAGEDFANKDYAKAAVTYYVDEIIKSPARQAELCIGPE
jgi:glyoxylase-like metal-dependent hydrolase (beta-lactamase superfamily II)